MKSQTIIDILMENKDPNHYGEISVMINLSPRKLVEGYLFYCTTLNKLYIYLPNVTQFTQKGGIRVEQICSLRSGNGIWVESSYNEEKQGLIVGVDKISHQTKCEYPDMNIEDELDCLVLCTKEFDVNSEDCKKKWSNLIQSLSSQTPLVYVLDSLQSITKGIINEEWKQQCIDKNNINAINFILNHMMEFVFLSWSGLC